MAKTDGCNKVSSDIPPARAVLAGFSGRRTEVGVTLVKGRDEDGRVQPSMAREVNRAHEGVQPQHALRRTPLVVRQCPSGRFIRPPAPAAPWGARAPG